MKRIYQMLIRLMAEPRSWLRAVMQRGRLEAEMEAEMASHLESLTADLMRAGYTQKEAVRRARIALGSVVVHKDEMRASLGLRLWDEFFADLRYAARRLRRSVSFTAVATISLALAIGTNTTIFSMAKQLLYERLAVAHATELRLLAWSSDAKHNAVHNTWGEYSKLPSGRATSSSFSYPVWQQLRADNQGPNRVMEDLFAFKETGMNGTIAGNAQRTQVEMVSGNYYGVLGVKPVLGRAIAESDETESAQAAVAVISYALWQRAFGGSAAVLGQTIKLNEATFTIVGVNPKSFTGAKSTQQSPDAFVPLTMQPMIHPEGKQGTLLTNAEEWWVNVMGRIRPGIADATARSTLDGELGAAARATMPVKPNEYLPNMELRDGSRGLFQQQRTFAKPMTVLLTMVGFVLLLACANIANLMLARGTQRQREMSVRLAMGAGRLRIARQMLVESLLMAAIGGIGGLMLGYFREQSAA